MPKLTESMQSRYNEIKEVHVWLIKRLIATSQSMDELRKEIAD